MKSNSDKKINTILKSVPKTGAVFDFLHPTRDTIISTMSSMRILMQNKRESQAFKGKDFNCFVLENRDTIGKSEVESFLSYLSDTLYRFPNNTRFQLAVCDVDGKHWYPIDCYIHDGKLSTLLFDASCVVSTIEPILKYIKNKFPTGEHYFFYGEKEKDKREILQYSDFDCAIFTREHVATLARLEPKALYSALKNGTRDVDIEVVDVKGSKWFTLQDITKKMTILAPMLRSTQSLTAMQNVPLDAKNTLVSKKKNQTLDAWLTENTTSTYIIKGEKYAKELQQALNTSNAPTRGFGFVALPELITLTRSYENKTKDEFILLMGQLKDLLNKIPQEKKILFLTLTSPDYLKALDVMKQLQKLSDKCKNNNSVKQILLEFADIMRDFSSALYKNDSNKILLDLAEFCRSAANKKLDFSPVKQSLLNMNIDKFIDIVLNAVSTIEESVSVNEKSAGDFIAKTTLVTRGLMALASDGAEEKFSDETASKFVSIMTEYASYLQENNFNKPLAKIEKYMDEIKPTVQVSLGPR